MGNTVYTTEIGDNICREIATSTIGLRHICNKLKLPYSTVTDWIYNEEHELSGKYARAKVLQMEHMADELLDIADDGSNDLMTIVKGSESYEQENKEVTTRSKLRLDTRKWLMSKLNTKKYGDKVDMTSNGKALPTAINIILDNGSSRD